MIEYSRIRKIHFVGIGGAGMSGIAEVLHNMGFIVSGSDIAEGETINRLRGIGIRIFLGHRKENIDDVETLVYSSAITQNNVEVRAAQKRKIPVIPRAEMLAELMRVKFSVAVAGTHGKTTTTSMISTILSQAGKDPTFVVGGKLKIGESGAKLGKSAYLIAEADESDGSFLSLFPTIAVINNIEDDHLDYYQNMERLRDSFLQFGNKVPFYGSVILNNDCLHSREILPQLNKRVLTFSLSSDTDIKAENVEISVFNAAFDLIVRNRNYGRIELNIGGTHNIYNALAAIATVLEIGIGFPVIKEGLQKFYLPERRFQVLFVSPDYLVIDDYAHHPTEIRTTIDTLKKGDFKRILAVFQPHRFTRLNLLMEEFVSAFRGVDLLIIAKLYAASQKEIENVNSKILSQKIGKTDLKAVAYIEEFVDIIKYLEQEMKAGDAVVFLSAGDLTHTAHRFADELEKKARKNGGTRQ